MKSHNSPRKSGNKRKMCDRRDEDGEEERQEIKDVVGKLEEELKEEMKLRLEQLSASLLIKLEKDRQEKRNKIGNIIRNLERIQIPISGIKMEETPRVSMPMGQGQVAAIIPVRQEEIPRKEEERQEADGPGGQDQSEYRDL